MMGKAAQSWAKVGSRAVLGLAVLVTTMTATLAGFAGTALAGTNGQQVELELGCGGKWGNTCPSGLDAVRVTGTNQWGLTKTEYASGNGGSAVFLKGWWWVGDITIYYNVNHKSQFPIKAWVPQVNDSGFDHASGSPNVVVVDAAYGGTLDYGTSWFGGNNTVAQGPWIPVGSGVAAPCIGTEDDPGGWAVFVKKFFGYYPKTWHDTTTANGASIYGPGIIPVDATSSVGPFPVCSASN